MDLKHSYSVRPWGEYTILRDKEDSKTKLLTVHPGKRLSLQRHEKRDETWVIVSGEGLVTVDSGVTSIGYGDVIRIKAGQIHRVENCGLEDLRFIEVQTGTYFGEDDIERLDDDYGRS